MTSERDSQGFCHQFRSSLSRIVSDFFSNSSPTELQLPAPPLDNLCPSLKSWSNHSEHDHYLTMCSGKKCSWIIPLGGNSFVTSPSGPPDEDPVDNFITPCGIANWSNGSKVITTYFHSILPGHVLLALRLRVLPTGTSIVKVTVRHAKPPYPPEEGQGQTSPRAESEGQFQSKTVELTLTGGEFQLVPCGKFFLPMDGYMALDLQGIGKSGPYFADVTHLLISPESDWFREQTCLKFVSDPADFYWGRRGPSVHLRYIPPENKDLEYFYTELTVPSGQDVIGAYFCAAGFHGGYFGIQVNTSTQRRILFSIWSAFVTDDPSEIPEEYKVKLIRKGPDVIEGEFGDEGSGGQSYLVYPWVAERTYRFLTHATKSSEEDTIYTSWYNPTGLPNDWNLIASFLKPKDSTFLRNLYAFSENFIPEQGHLERRCLYGNQWACDTEGVWTEILNAEFTADATANAKNRMDICGGVDLESGHFFLRNCGFFSDAVEANTYFQRGALGMPPQIDFGSLP